MSDPLLSLWQRYDTLATEKAITALAFHIMDVLVKEQRSNKQIHASDWLPFVLQVDSDHWTIEPHSNEHHCCSFHQQTIFFGLLNHPQSIYTKKIRKLVDVSVIIFVHVIIHH